MPLLTPAEPWKTNPGLALLHLVVWYAAAVCAFFAMTYTVSDLVPEDCQESLCSSPRVEALWAGLFLGAPAFFVALLISLVTLGVVSSRRPGRRAAWVGLLAATPAFLVLVLLVLFVVADEWA